MNWLAAILAFIKVLLGIKGKDPVVEQAKENEDVAENTAKVFAAPDRDRATLDDILRQHADQ